VHFYRHVGHEPREKDRSLHLRARRLAEPGEATQQAAVHRHRQAIAALEGEARAHCLQGTRHAFHRAPAQARVADDAGIERDRRENTRHEPRGGPAVAAVEGVLALAEAAKPRAAHRELLRRNRRNRGTECTQGAGRRVDIG
jgi:hypothetical protein